jgi:hypothetical protein
MIDSMIFGVGHCHRRLRKHRNTSSRAFARAGLELACASVWCGVIVYCV